MDLLLSLSEEGSLELEKVDLAQLLGLELDERLSLLEEGDRALIKEGQAQNLVRRG